MTTLLLLAVLLATTALGSAKGNQTVCSHPWQYFDLLTNSCQCYNNPATHGIVRCSRNRVEVLLGHCMTVDEDTGLNYVGSCPNNYPAVNYPNTTQAVYIVLPDNVTELNRYMCEGMHREGKRGRHVGSVRKATGRQCIRQDSYVLPVIGTASQCIYCSSLDRLLCSTSSYSCLESV